MLGAKLQILQIGEQKSKHLIQLSSHLRRSTHRVPFFAHARRHRSASYFSDTSTATRSSTMGGQHNISEDELPYDPAKLERKKDIGIAEFFSVDIRVGVIVGVQDFPEMRKPSYKIEVDFGPIIGKLNTSAQITNYSKDELLLRTGKRLLLLLSCKFCKLR